MRSPDYHSPFLRSPDYHSPFILHIDTSDVGIGAVLLQEDTENVLHPICYYSAKLKKYQLNYATFEEALALIMAFQHFEVYLSASRFPIHV